MRVCTIRNTELGVHPLVIAVAAGAAVLGQLTAFLQAVLALTLHELGHAMTAAAFGCRILSLEMQPFGGVARLTHMPASPQAELCVSAAGPVVSLIAAGAAAVSAYLMPRSAAKLEPFLVYNLMLAGVNLLPALPLDGGRIARTLLERRGKPRAAHLTASWMGVLTGAGMLGLSVYAAISGKLNATLPVMGLFLLLAAIRELAAAPERQLQALWRRQDDLRAGVSYPVHHVTARDSMRASEALLTLRANRYNLLRVVNAELRTLGELDEGMLILGIARSGADAPLSEILSFDRKEHLC